MVGCAFESAPSTALLKVIGTPISASRLLADTAPFAESVRKLAVSVLVPPPLTEPGLAVWVRRSHGSKSTAPETRSQGAADGPVLQPHQFCSAVAVPDARNRPLPNPLAVLPAMRL